MRVLLADDHAILLEGLQNLLEAHGIEVIAVAKGGREAVAQAKESRPDVVLMDIRMPDGDGLTATRVIKAEMPEVKIVILTTSDEDDDLFEAVRSGATGYLLKSIDAESLIEALRDAHEDVPPFAPGMATKLLSEFARSPQRVPHAGSPTTATWGPSSAPAPVTPPLSSPPAAASPAPPSEKLPVGHPGEPLSARQREVLSLVAQGLTYKEIGARVYLSPRTVKYHMAEIMRKLHLRNRAQVLALAGRLGDWGDRGEPL